MTSASATNLDGPGSYTSQCHNPGYTQQMARATGAGTDIANGTTRNIELRAVANGTRAMRVFFEWAPIGTTLSFATANRRIDRQGRRTTGFVVGQTVAVDTGANQEPAVIASMHLGAGGSSTSLALPSAAGRHEHQGRQRRRHGRRHGHQHRHRRQPRVQDHRQRSAGQVATSPPPSPRPANATNVNIKLTSVSGLAVGQTIVIDTGAITETKTIIGPVNAAASSTAPRAPAAPASPVDSLLAFNHATGAPTVATATGVTLTSSLALAHAQGAPVVDTVTGITLTAPLTKAHLSGAGFAGQTMNDAVIADAVAKASVPGTTPVFFVYDVGTEGSDRGGNNAAAGMVLPGAQDVEIQAVVDANPNTIVVAMTGAPVYMPWAIPQPGHNAVKSVLEMWYSGQRGGIATANVLLGLVNPGGKLPETFPVDATHYPQFETTCSQSALGSGNSANNVGTCSLYPGVYMPGFLMTATSGTLHGYRTINFSNSTLQDTGVSANPSLTYPDAAAAGLPIPTTTGNGIFTGYRWYDQNNVAPLFEFGRGLSYTTFDYSSLSVGPGTAGGAVDVSFDVKNTGAVAGDEVPQVYVGSPASPPVVMSGNALAGFQRIHLNPGQTQHLTIHLPIRAFQYWKVTSPNFVNNDTDGWATAAGCRTIAVGASSRDHRMHEVANESGTAGCPDITVLTQDFNPTQFGKPVTFTATVVGAQPDPAHVATGTVQFMIDGVNMGAPKTLDTAGVATLTTSALAIGTHVVEADYSGDPSYVPSSATINHSVKKRLAATTVVTSDINPSIYGGAVTYTATVAPENLSNGLPVTGFVQFSVDGAARGGPMPIAAGVATISFNDLKAGSRGIRAQYLGDANYAGSTSSSYAQQVKKATPTGSVISVPPTPITAASHPTFTATFVNPTTVGSLAPANVQFLIDGTNMGAPVAISGTPTGGTATFTVTWTLPTGNHTIKAKYLGNANFLAVFSAPYTVKINP